MEFIVKNALNKEVETEAPVGVSKAKIVVIGAGGAGNNSITRLMEIGGVKGANTIAVNTDQQQLEVSKADNKLLIGYSLTQGLGAGGYPEVGRKSAEASKKELRELLKGAHLVFLTCGMGGGTGTGSMPVIAEIAQNEGSIVIATVTTPFDLEKARIGKAEDGLIELKQIADTVIVIDNNKLVEYYPNLPLNKAFAVADELIANMIKGISETITIPSLINLDFADIKTVMHGGGVAMIGVGETTNRTSLEDAVKTALNHPLLDVDYKGGRGALIHVTGGPDMTLGEVTNAGGIISEGLRADSQVIWGARVDPTMEGKMRIMTIITGVKSPHILGKRGDHELPIQIGGGKYERQPIVLNELRIDYVS